MNNGQIIEKLLSYPEESKVIINNFEDDNSGTEIINVTKNENNEIILQISGDSQYLNTARFSLLETEHIILAKIMEELIPLINQNPRFFKGTNIPNILSNTKIVDVK